MEPEIHSSAETALDLLSKFNP